ncbi:hypothetical protein CFT12S00416_08930 [Campylobacter fetus subsp. testudinum]|uniref:hypothetical protein n=1 Tax=Campylobacter fetus TaxID=196 RepID=UPI0008189EF8|nr:hypothetical protein [Campylobacter fetus]OCR86949.1 hypothetical protein CFT12S00416_08930 [Campylobacter fetus subsp. testudinum]OCR98940.1 hypothetical protein A9K75_09205 [Campylobacter fetus subsp. testudinum]
MANIKMLNDKKATAIYTQEINNINYETGEILDKQEVKFVKEKNRNDFIQLYVENIAFLSSNEINNIERQTLIFILSEMTFFNLIRINMTLRKSLKIATGLSNSSISRSLAGLVEKNILIKVPEEECEKFNIRGYIGDEYLINPQLVGKGSFNEMKKLRQTVTTSFDFDKLEMVKEVVIESKYDGFDEVANNLDKHKIKEINQNSSLNGRLRSTEIVIEEKQEAEIVEPIKNHIPAISATSVENSTYKEEKLEELRLKRFQAEKEKIEAENEKIRLQIQLATLQKKTSRIQKDFTEDMLPSSSDQDF